MARHAITVRFASELHEELALLSELHDTSMNKMINEAVRGYVRQRRAEAERDLSETLERLRRYAEADPGYERAIQEFAAAELSHDDPVEGELLAPVEETEAQSALRELLDAS